MKTHILAMTARGALALGGTALAATAGQLPAPLPPVGYIVEAHSAANATQAVRRVRGRVTHELPIINGVSALLSASQAATLRQRADLQLFVDATVKTQGTPVIDKYARAFVGADLLAAQGYFGNGVTVAVLDTGLWGSSKVSKDLNGNNKVLATYDAIAGVTQSTPDGNGHGSHIASIIGSATVAVDGQPMGIAPMAKLVGVKAFDDTGLGSSPTSSTASTGFSSTGPPTTFAWSTCRLAPSRSLSTGMIPSTRR